MAITVVGTVTLDTVETPQKRVEDVLGGSGVYAAIAASFFGIPVRLLGIVGDDFPQEYIDVMQSSGIDLEGLTQVENAKSFRWGGRYSEDFNVRDTLFTELNVIADFHPVLPDAYKETPFLFLANDPPQLQLSIIEESSNPKLVVCDTMDFWINEEREALEKTIEQVDILILNDSEARLLTGESNLIQAAREILCYGPERVIIKKGEHGAISITESSYFSAPAYPLTKVIDPTGAGDSFAGGFMGYLASADDVSEHSIRKAMIYGTVIASFNIEDFSVNRQQTVQFEEIKVRYQELQEAAWF
ncbi:sugar kinase [Candidatus Poribacteria bacterium]|nr:sugar kinase [Candidatus Poribacteria bacterium]MYF57159.1 sugar kinase [Candidatus Poribacteria bacterium]MYI93844.1 sugar kinase [Candidatus Poribacteria bacterium]